MIFIIRVLYPFRAFKRSNPFPQIVLLKIFIKCALKSENVVWTIRFFDGGPPKLFIVARKLTAINIELSDAVGSKKLSRNIFPFIF